MLLRIHDLKDGVLAYINSLRVGKLGYKYGKNATKPVLYGLDYALLTRHLLGEDLPSGEKQEIASYIQSFQDDDGLFKDPAIADGPVNAEYWGWKHLTRFSFMALCALGKTVRKELLFLEPFYNSDFIVKWLNERDFSTDRQTDNAAMEIYNYGTLLQYARDFHNTQKAKRPLEIIIEWLSEKQSPKHGFWGPEKWEDINEHSNLMMAAYHIGLLYFYEGLSLNYKERVIDNVLALQSKTGGFSGPHHPLSSACQDIDAIYIMAQLTSSTDYLKSEIKLSLEKTIPCILSHQNSDGGFSFYKDEPFQYGSVQMYSGVNESGIFPTWFRTLSCAFVSQISSQVAPEFKWGFLDCPGAQFWRE